MANILINPLFKLRFTFFHLPKGFLTGSRNFASWYHPKRTQAFKTPVKRRHKTFPLFEKSTVNLAPKLSSRPKQKFDYFLVLDFEATCDSPGNLDPQVREKYYHVYLVVMGRVFSAIILVVINKIMPRNITDS